LLYFLPELECLGRRVEAEGSLTLVVSVSAQ
jgi:hypothetical protein